MYIQKYQKYVQKYQKLVQVTIFGPFLCSKNELFASDIKSPAFNLNEILVATTVKVTQINVSK
jgi:hypothetical protein